MPKMPQTLKNNPGKAGGIALVLAASFAAIAINEGGHANNKHDRGGETNFGITIGTARANGYTGRMKDFPWECSEAQPICAKKIYQKTYMERPGYMPFASIEPAVFYELVDSAVLHGPSRSSGWLQLSLNAECGSKLVVDAKVGPATVGAYKACRDKRGAVPLCVSILDRLDGAQTVFFKRIVARNQSQGIFLRGWLAQRVGNVDRRDCGKGWE